MVMCVRPLITRVVHSTECALEGGVLDVCKVCRGQPEGDPKHGVHEYCSSLPTGVPRALIFPLLVFMRVLHQPQKCPHVA